MGAKTTILVIDADTAKHALLDHQLEGVVDEILHAMSADHGLSLAREASPDAILLSVELSGTNGYQVCRTLHLEKATRLIPVILLMNAEAAAQIARGLDSGAFDFIRTPYEPIELQARLRAALRTRRQIELLMDEARIDRVSGLHNRQSLDEQLEACLLSEDGSRQRLTLLLVHLDELARISDDHESCVGDDLIRVAAQRLEEAGGDSCRPFRFRGATFAVIVTVPAIDAKETFGRLLKAARFKFITPDGPIMTRAHAGAVMISSSAVLTVDEITAAADRALSRAREGGDERVLIEWFGAAAA